MFLQLLVTGIYMGSIYSLVALSMVLIVNAVNVINFAEGEFVMLGSFLIVTTAGMWNLPYPLAILAAIIIMAAFGFIFHRITYHPLRDKGFLPFIISTLGCSLLLQNTAQVIWGPQPLYVDPPFGTEIIKIGNLLVQPQHIFIVVVTAIALIFQYLLFERLPIGRRLRAAAQDPETASLMGIPVTKMIIFTFIWSAVLGGIAGVLFAPIFYVTTTMGLMVTLKAFASLVIGGWGSIVGAIIGGLFIGVAETLLAGYVSSVYKDAFVFLILIVFLVIRPLGLMGEREQQRV